MRTEVTIPSHGETLAAYVYLPDGEAGGPLPCVVMAHGFSATRDDAIPGYAEAFVGAGFAAVAFDYRHLGASTGQPRQLIDIAKQQEDYRAVVAWVRADKRFDADRVALWGSSFSGGHVIAVAATDPRIAAVISQCPFTDGIATLKKIPVRNQILATSLAVADMAAARLGRDPICAPAVGDPGTFAAMTAPEAKPGFEAIVEPGSKWENRFAARVMLHMPTYRPVTKAASLQMPLLVCVCDGDETTPPEGAVAAAERAPRGELEHFPYGHFAIYHDPAAKERQVAFLTRHLSPVAAAATA